MSIELDWHQHWPLQREFTWLTLLTYVIVSYYQRLTLETAWEGSLRIWCFCSGPGNFPTEEKGLQMSPAKTHSILVMETPLRNSHCCIAGKQFKRTDTSWMRVLSLSPLEKTHVHTNQIRMEIQLCSRPFDFRNNLKH